MKLKDIIIKNRSYRRFFQEERIEEGILRELIDLARLSASASNLQPLKYLISADPQKNDLIYPCLAWAGYLRDWPGPAEGEQPAAYIIILGDRNIRKSFGCDQGIAAQSILLGAVEKGLGGCMVGSIRRLALRKALAIPKHLQILLVIALGKPKEEVVIEEIDKSGDIKYWRDHENIHHVPKRKLEDIIY